MRVVFAGTPEVAVPALDAVAASRHELVGVVTRPDAPSGRGRRLVASLTGTWYKSEARVFKKVAALGIDTVEQVLLYHVVPGAPITAATALKSDGAKLKTAAGTRIKVKVVDGNVKLVDKDPDAPHALNGVGSVHHIAWRASGENEQSGLREILLQRGVPTTPVVDRQYFRSIYFREPGGVLFEVATDGPGFLIDEPVE